MGDDEKKEPGYEEEDPAGRKTQRAGQIIVLHAPMIRLFVHVSGYQSLGLMI